MSLFDDWFAQLMEHEGAYSDDPRDPGNWTGGKEGVGKLLGTKYGIAANTFPTLDIRNLTLADAAGIYRVRYFPQSFEALPPGIAWALADAAVNSGMSRAVKWLQQVVGSPADGLFGPATLRAVQSAVQQRGAAQVRAHMLTERALFMAALPTFSTYGRGWFRRLFSLKAF
ncbi:glycoside hydrolase family 108 protein [Roseomonas sp. USHLN139]|uniref:glycoside hydrolase family 108 protein n=1 Tax=Roseomonas sp. USHLN139 TaxID=3081298 RepID=UPI003B01E018